MAVILAPSGASAHEGHCTAVAAFVAGAGLDDRFTVTSTDAHAIIESLTDPDHEKMTGIVGTNEQVPAPAGYGAPIRFSPVLGTTPLTRDATSGGAINVVPVSGYTCGGEMTHADLAHHQPQELDV
ncbi:MAG: hypothetical protein NXH97_16225 [Rhodobacteraceae bacterium]|nr:hypothetical protein [Paracoccaceae bacterium]